MSLIVAALSRTLRRWHGTHRTQTNTARATRLPTKKRSDPAGRGGKGLVGGVHGALSESRAQHVSLVALV